MAAAQRAVLGSEPRDVARAPLERLVERHIAREQRRDGRKFAAHHSRVDGRPDARLAATVSGAMES